MTFYQELQLDQAGSKAYIASFKNTKDKIKHIGVYLFKIVLNIAFCTAFIAVFSMLFGTGNSIAGLAVLLSVMVFRCADLGIRTSHAVCSILAVFGILAAGPRLSNMLPPGWAFLVNAVFIMFIMLLGCHNVVMYNHSTLVLAYLLLQGYDVSGTVYSKRLAGLFAGAVITAVVYYHNHRKKNYKRTFKSFFQEFDLSSARTKWQLRLALVISSAMYIASILDIPKPMWIGIAAMSVCVPFRNDISYRVKYRAPGNILGSLVFLCAYLALPEGSVAYMGILGGIGTGLSASYGWQAVFNAFSSLATAVPVFGLQYAIILRILCNVSGSVYTWIFDRIFEPVISCLGNIVNFLEQFSLP
ncbi:MAG: FUSC family protein [Lachnospiraceae bacterium]|nr:FUSC family protein [Lachnospiraceae bacterium]